MRISTVPVWRRDLTASCKTGEILEPGPASGRWRELRQALPWVLLIGGCALASRFWFKSELSAVSELMRSDRLAGLHRRAEILTWFMGGLGLLGVGLGTWLMLLSVRTLRSGRWPSRSARVLRPTPVIAGWCLWLRFGIPLLLVPLLIFTIARSAVQLVAWSWNTYTDARTQVLAPAAIHTAGPALLRRGSADDQHNG